MSIQENCAFYGVITEPENSIFSYETVAGSRIIGKIAHKSYLILYLETIFLIYAEAGLRTSI